jgi:Flp pilus assembly protein TadG
MQKQRNKRRGAVTVLVAICLVGMMSFVALSVDGGLLLDDRQKVQSTADAAALAAGNQLYYYWKNYAGLDTNGAAASAAKAAAAAGGFSNVTVNVPPQAGAYKGLAGYVEVIVQYNQKRYFSSIAGTSDTPVIARAVAQGRWAPFNNGVLVLNPTAPGSLTSTGGGSMIVAGVPTIVDSNNAAAITTSGGGTVTSSEFDVVGNPGFSGSGVFNGTINAGSSPIPDPLAYLPEPDASSMPVQSKNATHVSGTDTITLSPGVYRGGITASGQGSVIMQPGVYYMDGGGFTFTGQGNLQAQGVVIFNAPKSNSDNISINGTGSISFSPPTTGLYQGISLWQQRSANNTLYVSGNGGSSMTGTFYTANGTLNVTGNGTNDVIGSQYISYNLTVNGNGGFNVAWNANQTAKTRYITLVE